MSQVTGRVFIALNGQRIRSKEGAMLDVGGFKRDAQLSDAGVDGFSESPAAPSVECKINDTVDVSLDDFKDFKDGTIVFETDTGKTYTLHDAWIAEPPKLTSKDGWTLKFEAKECIQG